MPSRSGSGSGTGLAEAPRSRVRSARPPKYLVVMFNDDYTPAEFVVAVLCDVFRMGMEQAVTTMMAIHTRGAAACGVYPRDVAETKVAEVERIAQKAGHPLKARLEKE